MKVHFLSHSSHIFFFFFFFLPCHATCGILVFQPGIKPRPSAVKAQSQNHWTNMKVLSYFLSVKQSHMLSRYCTGKHRDRLQTIPILVNGEGNGTPLQYSCLENPMDGGAWQAAVHGVAQGRTRLSNFTFMHRRRKWQPTPVFLPGESQGQGSLVGCRLWGHSESDTTEVTQQQHPCEKSYWKVLNRQREYGTENAVTQKQDT